MLPAATARSVYRYATGLIFLIILSVVLSSCDAIREQGEKGVNLGVYASPPDGDPEMPGIQPVALGSNFLMNLTVRNDGVHTAFPPIVVTDTVAVEYSAAAGDQISLVIGPTGTSWKIDREKGVVEFTLLEPLAPGASVRFSYEVVFGQLGPRSKTRFARVIGLGEGQENDPCAQPVDMVMELLPAGVRCVRATDGDAIDVWVSGDSGQDNGEDLYALALLLADRGVRVIGVDAVGWWRVLAGKESPQHCDPDPPRSSWEMYDRMLRFLDARAHVPLYSGAVCGTPEPTLPRDPARFSPGAYLLNQAVLALVDELARRIREDEEVLHYVATGTVTNLAAALVRLRDDPLFQFSEEQIGRKLVVHMEGFDFAAPHLDVHLNMGSDPTAFRVLFEWDPALRLFVLPVRPDQVGFEYKFVAEAVDGASTPCSGAFMHYMMRRWQGTSGDYPCGDPTYIFRTTTLQIGGGVLGYIVSRGKGGMVSHPDFEYEDTTAPIYRDGRLDWSDNFLSNTGGRAITLYRVPTSEQRARIRQASVASLLSIPCAPHVVCWFENG